MLGIVFVLLTTAQAAAQPAPQDEVKDALAHAEALYYAARFSDSIALLTRVDDLLKTQPARQQEKIDTKLRLALAHIGLNDTVKAKSYFIEVYALNPGYALDADLFSPKVVAVASDAKAEQFKARCSTTQTEARAQVDAGQIQSFLTLLRSLGPNCGALDALKPEAAEVAYKAGAAAFKRGDLFNALSNFEMALALSPEHELAREYADLTRGKIQVGQDRSLIDWQRAFDAHQFKEAAADYSHLAEAKDKGSTTALAYVRSEYRKALSGLVDEWNRTCAGGNRAALSALRGQISELLPEPSFGEDLRAQMISCEETKKADINSAPKKADINSAPKAENDGTCLTMQSQLALTRLRSRVDPAITGELRLYLKINPQAVVRVKARINESGDVTVTGITDGNPLLNNAVRAAVTQWKFTPVRDDSGARCVDTEITLALKLGQ